MSGSSTSSKILVKQLFGIRKPGSQPQGIADGGDSLSLCDLLSSMASSILDSTHSLRNQHIDAIAEYFEPAPKEGGEVAGLKPRTLALHLQRAVTERESQGSPSAVPLAALVQNDPIVLDEASLEMRCRIVGFDPPGSDGVPRMRVRLAPEGSGSPLRINLKYKQSSVPEAVARIDDSLVRGL